MNAQVDNAKDLEVLVPIYNLLAHSDNYSITSKDLRKIKDTSQTK